MDHVVVDIERSFASKVFDAIFVATRKRSVYRPDAAAAHFAVGSSRPHEKRVRNVLHSAVFCRLGEMPHRAAVLPGACAVKNAIGRYLASRGSESGGEQYVQRIRS